MKPQEFINQLYDAAQKDGIKEFAIGYTYGSNSRVEAYEQEIAKRTDNEKQAVMLQVKIGKNIGGFGCGELKAENIPLMIQNAKENAELIDCEEENFFHDGSGEYLKAEKYQPLPEFEKLDIEKFALDVEKACYALDKRVEKVIAVSVGSSESRSILKNSLGLDIEEKTRAASASVFLSVKEKEQVRTGGEAILFDKPEHFNPEYIAQKAVERAVKKLDGKDVASGRTKVVFDKETMADVLDLAVGLFSANSVNEKRSKLAGKIGELVAAPCVTLIDDPFIKGGYGTRSFDAEGYPAQKNVVVQNGVLKMFFHNLRTAHLENVKSTGNGSGGRGISTGNFYLVAGEYSKDEILKAAGKAIYINRLNGMHAGYTPVSGDFSFGAEGFLIENGKLGQTLNQFTVSGNIYQLLLDIEMIGNDLSFENNSTGAPTVLVKKLAVSCE